MDERKSIGEIVDYLNLKASRNYRPDNRDTQRIILGRLREGYTVEDFKRVIDIKCEQWNNVPMDGSFDMRIYLRPKTLFGHNFDNYLNEPEGWNGTGLY